MSKSSEEMISLGKSKVNPSGQLVMASRGIPMLAPGEISAEMYSHSAELKMNEALKASKLESREDSREEGIRFVKELCRITLEHIKYNLDLLKTKTNTEIVRYCNEELNRKLVNVEDFKVFYIDLFSKLETALKNVNLMLDEKDVDMAYLILYVRSKAYLQSFKGVLDPVLQSKKWTKIFLCKEMMENLEPYLFYAESLISHMEIIPHVPRNSFRESRWVLAINFPGHFNSMLASMDEERQAIDRIISDPNTVFSRACCDRIFTNVNNLITESRKIYSRINNFPKPTRDNAVDLLLERRKLLKSVSCLCDKFISVREVLEAVVQTVKNTIALDQRFQSGLETEILKNFFMIKFEYISDMPKKREGFVNLVKKFREEANVCLTKMMDELKEVASGYNGESKEVLFEKMLQILAVDPEEIINSFVIKIAEAAYPFVENLVDLNEKNKARAKRDEEEDKKAYEQMQREFELRLRDHQAQVEEERKKKRDLKAQDKAAVKESANETRKLQALEEKERKEKVDIFLQQLKDRKLNSTVTDLIDVLFSEHPPHHKIMFNQIEHLIKTLGGELRSAGGSHQKIVLGDKFCLLEETDSDSDSDSKSVREHKSLSERKMANDVAAAKGQGLGQGSCIVVKPHGASHNPGYLPSYALRHIRTFLQEVGVRFVSKTTQNGYTSANASISAKTSAAAAGAAAAPDAGAAASAPAAAGTSASATAGVSNVVKNKSKNGKKRPGKK